MIYEKNVLPWSYFYKRTNIMISNRTNTEKVLENTYTLKSILDQEGANIDITSFKGMITSLKVSIKIIIDNMLTNDDISDKERNDLLRLSADLAKIQ